MFAKPNSDTSEVSWSYDSVNRQKYVVFRFYIEIYGSYLVIVLLILNQIYVHRLRWLVCACAYPKRQKYRILFLYNKILKDRRNFITVMKHKLSSIRYNPVDGKVDSYLDRWFGDHYKCDICHEKVNKKNADEFLLCSCHVRYCLFCLQDTGNQCLKCGTFLHKT